MKVKRLVFTIIMSVTLLTTSVITFALTPSTPTTTTERNLVAYNWSYSYQGYYEQNCLAYAIDAGNIWVWPWGSSNPTKAQVQSYLTSIGFLDFLDAGVQGAMRGGYTIYAYELNGRITHFAKHTSSGASAKWGHCEVFNHTTNDPYTNYIYGKLSFRSSWWGY